MPITTSPPGVPGRIWLPMPRIVPPIGPVRMNPPRPPGPPGGVYGLVGVLSILVGLHAAALRMWPVSSTHALPFQVKIAPELVLHVDPIGGGVTNFVVPFSQLFGGN